MSEYPQRSDYMAGKVTFEEFYASVAKVAGISYAQSDLLPRVKLALEAGDEHLNTIPLSVWDRRAAYTSAAVARSLKLHGDFYSLAGGVCVHKQAAKLAAVTWAQKGEK